MENVNEIIGIFQGGLTTVQLFMLMRIMRVEEKTKEERQHNISTHQRQGKINEDHDKRIKNLEIKAYKHWSSHDYT